MRIGLFGGTFDPIHIGHLIIAQQAAEQLRLDKLFIVPARVSPHKRGIASTAPRHRLAMARLAARGNPRFAVSDVEIRREGPSYTADTLLDLRRRFRGARITLVVGGDSLADLPRWKDPQTLVRFPVAVAARDDEKTRPPTVFRVTRLATPMMAISSTDIRRRIGRGLSIKYLVPPAVETYIIGKRLYTTNDK